MTATIGFAELLDIVRTRGASLRSITAIAGPPGSGKSTLAERLEAALNELEPGSAAVLPMDGYHYDDRVLEARGLRPIKGAPETFDVGGFAAMLERLRRNDEAEIAVPVFDRSIEIARAGARLIPARVRHLLVEGNYLLLDEGLWRNLRSRYDTTVLLVEPEETLRTRLEARWAGLSPEARSAKIDGNDLPNARRVLKTSLAPDFLFG